MQQPLTEAQEKVYHFIKKYVHEHGYSPSVREIMKEFKFSSPNSVAVHINNLKKRGYLLNGTKNKSTARSLRLVEDILANNGNQFGRNVTDNEVRQAISSVHDKGFTIDYIAAHHLLHELGFTFK